MQGTIQSRQAAPERMLRVVIDSVFPLKQAAEAHRRIESGVDRGKIVLKIAEDG